ncbi:MAG TPA: GDSL-type esterase/lipase family protein [Candidatus Thermoplasmatota archaeon]|nr:GDSL-type esterase/lipase family protein [Candidatus Thermoplasmatota archaeon]
MRWLVPAVLALLAGCAADAPEPAPRVLAALGDSITRALNAAGPGERPASSWATGHDAADGVLSLAERLVAQAPGLSGNVHNLAQSGARMDDLPRQARLAVDARADAVVLLLGANDACASPMTDEAAFRAGFRAGAQVLRDGLPDDAVVYVASFPNVSALREAAWESAEVRERWRLGRPCAEVLDENATHERRAQTAARVEALNRALMEEAASFGFATDGLAVFRSEVEAAHLSRVDAFHPSLAGQAALADVAWDASPWAQR